MFFLFASLYAGPTEPAADEAEVQALVGAARVGNTRAASRLYRLHVARVYRAVRPLCAGDAEAEDATQQAFVDALGRLSRYAPRSDARFVGWLVTLALNRARQQHRRARREEPTEDQPLGALVEPGGSDEEERLVRKATLLAALAELPERDRQALCLFYGAELTADETARALGLSAANVRKICERQRQHLLSRLEPKA